MQLVFPKNFKEEIIMAVPNCCVMAMGMMTMNLWVFNGLTLSHWLNVFPLIYITAFVTDFFFIGKITTKIANKYNIQKYQPLFRVAAMAGLLTFVAPLVESFGTHIVSFNQYITALPRNYIVALFLQVAVAMPLGCVVLAKYRKLFAQDVVVSK